MDSDVLGRAMREATDELSLQPDFTSRVVRGGQRRAGYRRARIVAAVVAVLALAAVGAVAAQPKRDADPPVPPAAPVDARLDRPTKGDLARDTGFLDEAVRAWEKGIAESYNAERGVFDDRRGDPHVYWAGNTPAGPTAVVLQRTFVHPSDELPTYETNRWRTLVGLVATDPGDGKLKLVGDQYETDGWPTTGRFRFGPEDRTILVLDVGLPMYFSAGVAYGADGKIVRDWQRMTVTDGISVAQIPATMAATGARVCAGSTQPARNGTNCKLLLQLERASDYLTATKAGVHSSTVQNHHLPWAGPNGEATPNPGTVDDRVLRVGAHPTVPGDFINGLGTFLRDGGYLDTGMEYASPGRWGVAAELSDGRTALVGEYQQGDDASQLYAVLVDRAGQVRDIRYGGPVDPTKPLPVAIRMPAAQGWVVAAFGSHLRYRTVPNGDWRDGGEDAALLPDGAIAVRVTPRGAAPVEVTLAR